MRKNVLIAFVTLTFPNGEIPTGFEELFKAYVDKKATACCAVRESGKYGGNSHYHMYIVLRNACGTDSLTRSLRGMYPKELGTNRFTVLTLKEKDPIYRIGCYFAKETDSERIILKNINMEYYIEEWNKRKTLSTMLLKEKNFVKYSINQLPSVYLAYCDSHELPYDKYEIVFAEMYRDGKIQVSQFKQLKYVRVAVDMLKGGNLPENLLQILS